MMKKFGLLTLVTCLMISLGYASELTLNAGGKNNLIIKENSYEKLRIRQELSQLQKRVIKTERGNFSEISVDGYNFTTQVGSPKLPVKSQLIEIPVGAEINVIVKIATSTEYSLAELGIEYPVIPLQPPVSKNSETTPPLVYNGQAYQRDQFGPGGLATVDILGMMRGVRVARLNLFPVQYNPVTHKIKVYELLDVLVEFKHPDLTATLRLKKNNDNPYFSGLNRMLVNYKPLNHTAKDTLTEYPVKYVIVSPVDFQPLLQPFIQWKRMKGFNVIEAYTNNPAVGNTTTSIKNYLQGLYLAGTPENPAPSFILIVGDIDQVPSFNGATGGHKTDMYYAEYTGDDFPEAFIGRFSAENESQLVPQLNKTIEYEKYLMPDPSFLGEVVMIAGVDANFAPVHANGQINYGTDTYFNLAHGLSSYTYLYPQSGTSGTQIIQDVSNGVGYANYTAHGSSSGWANPSFSVSDVDGLQNQHQYPLMVGNCCLTNKFDDPLCFGEALLRANNRGAFAYIGGTNVTYWDEDYYWGVGVRAIVANPVWAPGEQRGAYDCAFHDHGEPYSDWYVTNGSMIHAGNMAVTVGSANSSTYYWEVYMLMGDPSAMTYFGIPPAMTVSYDNLMNLAVTSFTVNTEPYTYVAISQNGVLHGATLADSNGLAIVNLDPITTPGYAHIVITGQNWQPVIDSIIVASPSGPFVLIDNYLAHEFNGNNNGQIDFNEDASVNITLKNWGQASANSVTMSISTTDPYVTITDNAEIFGNIDPSNMSTHYNAFTFSVANNVPDQHIVNFEAVISDNGGNNWIYTFTALINAPHFTVGSVYIDDNTTGNGNGRLDPGETADIVITGINSGHSDAPNTIGTLSENTPLLNLNTNTSAMYTLMAAASGTATFNVTISATAQVSDIIPVDFSFASGAYSAAKTFNLTVGIVSEDWETHTLTHLNWVTGGSSPWFISINDPYEGSFCLQSGMINDNQSSDLLIQGTVLIEDTLSFFRKVSSEEDYDFLKFYVDATKLDQWAGNVPWGREAYIISPGLHTFKWTYKKDGSQIGGSDAAWLDNIIFPPVTGLTTSIADPQQVSLPYVIYPNPSGGQTQLSFSLDKPCEMSISIYNALGQRVSCILENKILGDGNHSFTINTAGLPQGIYYVNVTNNQQVTVLKLIKQ